MNKIIIPSADCNQLLSLQAELEAARTAIKKSTLTVNEKWLVRKYAYRQDWDIVKDVYDNNPFEQRNILALYFKEQEVFALSDELQEKYNCCVYVLNNQVIAEPFPSNGELEFICFLGIIITLLGIAYYFNLF